MIGAGDALPDVRVWISPRKSVRLHELAPPGTAFLLLFYLFDWSST